MIKKVFSRVGLMAFAVSAILFATKCSKDEGDGNGCLNTVYAPIDVAVVPASAVVGDSVMIIVHTYFPNYCYTNYTLHASKGEKSYFFNTDVQYNSCQECATSIKTASDTFKFLADKSGDWRFQFRNNDSDIYKYMTVY